MKKGSSDPNRSVLAHVPEVKLQGRYEVVRVRKKTFLFTELSMIAHSNLIL